MTEGNGALIADRAREDEWLWGWDPTPGIVSVWADPSGRALIWRRDVQTRALLREEARFRPWLLLASLADVQHLGPRLRAEGDAAPSLITYEELEGTAGLRYVLRADDGRALAQAVLHGARRRLGRSVSHLRELGAQHVH